jgi:cardiolipin synthase
VRHVPNLLTLCRLLSVPVTVWLMVQGHMTWAFWLFVAAGATDAVDGALARLLNARSVLGAYLDPIADKALLMSIYVVFGWLGHLDSWLVIMVVFRDLLILGGAILMLFLSEYSSVDPLYISKVNTFMQIVLAAVVLANLGLGFGHAGLADRLSLLVALTTVLSGLAYIVVWGRRLTAPVGPVGKR